MRLEDINLADEDLRLLSESESFRRLHTLRLSSSNFDAACGELLGLTPFRSLSHLYLNGTRLRSLGDEGISRLLRNESLSTLGVLELKRQNLTSAIIPQILDSAIMDCAYRLDLRNNRIDDVGADILASTGPWPRLALLDLRGNQLSSQGREKLRKTFGYRVVY